ncbi:hypothetical protein ZIOFF_024615 [Zingiber officinale]|uniref:Uncharacterized protein n=1 Tax=Zingiber officinale TaxID=94328 RepID=A0A8J5GTU2_ZINOF|nr:hypothetical protein ZIOFF_024615 [Zingiber officinale]
MMSSQHPSLTLEGFALAAHVPVSKLARYSSTKEGKALELGLKKRIDTAKMCYGLYLCNTPQPMEVLVVNSDFSKVFYVDVQTLPISWSNICRPKEERGLGFRDLKLEPCLIGHDTLVDTGEGGCSLEQVGASYVLEASEHMDLGGGALGFIADQAVVADP